MKKIYALLILGIAISFSSGAQYLWNYSDTVYHSGTPRSVYLYLPPSCQAHVRGLLMVSHTVAEAQFVRDTNIRRVCNEEQLGILYINPSPMSNFGNPSLNPADTIFLNRVLQKMALLSGFPEIEFAPWITFGHSTSSAWARNLAWWKPNRTAGVVIFKGGAFSQPPWTTNTIEQVPVVGVSGEFEEFGPLGGSNDPRNSPANYWAMADSIFKLRAATPSHNLNSMILMPGEGHFGMPQYSSNIISLWVKKAAKYRIPTDTFATVVPITLNALDPAKGFLSDTTVFSGLPNLDSLPNYTGNQSVAYWWFDREMADAWKAHVTSQSGRTRQTITVTTGNFQNAGLFYRSTQNYGSPLTISATSSHNATIEAEVISGPCKITGPLTFELLASQSDQETVWLNLYTPADGSNKLVHRTYLLARSNQTGSPNSITIPTSSNQTVGDLVSLTTSASSGLPVEISVLAGPVSVAGNTLTVHPFPTKTGNTTAYVRFGQGGGSGFQTANFETLVIPITGPITGRKSQDFAQMVKIYPQPAKNEAKVVFAEEVKASPYTLFNLLGAKVQEGFWASGKSQTLNLSGLKPGIYWLSLPTAFSGKVVKQVVVE